MTRWKNASSAALLMEIWDVCFALESSLCSIIRDEVTDKAALMNQSIDEFDEWPSKGLVTSWGAGKTAQIVKQLVP